ncbi:hypothetical protein PIB30_010473 [Stylosanthes scabra]|uniref:Uncharacterized protein n=1 Tax=Stylosanthes scabra TaxID=79078 RepID=A0ABU6Z421_9FABA|nr:hypothetical protein [Stylosanthes scabra]
MPWPPVDNPLPEGEDEEFARQAGRVYLHWDDFKKLKQVNKRNRASLTGGSLHTRGSTTYEFTRERMVKRLQDERQAIIDAGGPEPPPPHHRRGCGVGTGSGRSQAGENLWHGGPPDLREQVTLLNGEITQQAKVHARVAAVEPICVEKVRILESTVQTQSQEVFDLRKAYSDMYIFLTQMRSEGSDSAAMPDMPPPPPPPPSPPPAPSQTPPPQHDQGGTGSPSMMMTPIIVSLSHTHRHITSKVTELSKNVILEKHGTLQAPWQTQSDVEDMPLSSSV